MTLGIENDPEALQLQKQHRMLSWMLSKELPPIPTQDERTVYPERTTNIFSRVFFWWLHPVLKVGYSRTLVPEDMFILSQEDKVEAMAEKFFGYFAAGLDQARTDHLNLKYAERNETRETTTTPEEEDLEDFDLPKLVTVMAILQTFKWQYFFSCLFSAIANVANVGMPLLTKKLIEFVERRAFGLETNIGRGIGYSLGASFFVLTTGILLNHFFYRSMLTGAQAKAVLIKAILTKSFLLSAESKHKYPTGKITSLMGTDLARVDFAIGLQPIIVTFPIPFGASIAILVVNIGASAVVGIAIMLVFMGAIGWCIGKLIGYRQRASKYTDQRVEYIKEILANLKIIKYYAWEPPYHKSLSEVRKKEMRLVFNMQLLRSIAIAVAMSLTSIASMVAFLVLYRIGGGKRTPANIFSSISLFNILTQTVIMLPLALTAGVDGLLGLGRVGDFLSSSESDPEALKTHANATVASAMEKDNIAIQVQDASFEWDNFDEDEEEEKTKEQLEEDKKTKKKDDKKAKKEKKKLAKEKKKGLKSPGPEISNATEKKDEKVTEKTKSDSDSDAAEVEFPGLQDINLSIKKGEFVVITGLIGTGKTSLLNALSGFMNRTEGSVNVNGSLLLCGYPWIQNATVKENIIFNSKLDEARYKEVIYSCSLESDLDIFPGGDQTEVGERGITLSGGQKARVNLARAVYAAKDIILMDDVLSAVDARVGKHIMNTCILGMLKDSTRILATHQLSLIGAADRIIFLNGDGSISTGTLDELKLSNAGFSNLMEFSHSKEEEEEVEVEEKEEEELNQLERELTKLTRKSVVDDELTRKAFNENNTDDGQLILDEHMAVNKIELAVYLNYIRTGSGKYSLWSIVPAFLFFTILATFSELFTNTWLSFWTEYKFAGRSNGFYIGLYVMFCMLSVVFLVCEFVILVYVSNTASMVLNVYAVERVLQTPMSFMDTTPMGRILNRFTKDTDALDNEIGDEIRMFIFTMSQIFGVIILCIIYLPWFAIAVPFLGYMFVAIADYYQASAREIKRLEAVQRSHVYNNFNETLNGMPTIKAYDQEARFITKNDVFINNMNEAYYLTIANQRWLAIHLDMVATLFSLLISILCVCRVFKLSPASVGLLLSYVLNIAGQLSFLLRSYTQMENAMNSVERVSEYAFKLPQEAPYLITETTPHESWPAGGEISFDRVDLSYRPGLPLVLKDVSFSVKPAEKIGICGRTGAGKSSIMTALYRLSELQKGSITIDGIDISTLGLTTLRQKLSIIPQDPVLFRGNIRKNLDPFNESSDDKLWDALRRTGLIEASRLEIVKKQVKVEGTDTNESFHKFHLNQPVEDEGSNFSLGERQLIAFARALVRDSKILILDEATSSVDYETDSKIQETIIKEFGHCTILCIAHRLKTILNYNRILVLDKGEVKEFDTPKNLFDLEDSIFRLMCSKSGVTADDFAVDQF